MFVRIWRFTVAAPNREDFERAYGPEGDWARLFARRDGYLGTELLVGLAAPADGTAAYVTLDRWRDEADWTGSLADHGGDYSALDRRCESLTVEESEIGAFGTP